MKTYDVAIPMKAKDLLIEGEKVHLKFSGVPE